jgi:hypothetical protein
MAPPADDIFVYVPGGREGTTFQKMLFVFGRSSRVTYNTFSETIFGWMMLLVNKISDGVVMIEH